MPRSEEKGAWILSPFQWLAGVDPPSKRKTSQSEPTPFRRIGAGESPPFTAEMRQHSKMRAVRPDGGDARRAAAWVIGVGGDHDVPASGCPVVLDRYLKLVGKDLAHVAAVGIHRQQRPQFAANAP